MKQSQSGETVKTIRDYFADGKHYAFVVLFGSFAREEATPQSDADIGVFFMAEADPMQAAYDQAKLASMLQRKVDLVVLNGLPAKDPLMAFEILSSHRLLVETDLEAYYRFKTAAQLSYLDHKPLLESNAAGLRRRILESKTGERNYA